MGEEQPFFSIIIPTYNRPGQLGACLHSFAQLDYPRDRFEVIVVDDGSETLPEAVVAPFHDQLNVSLLTQAHAGPATARNTGAARARGEFLAFTDDDCKPVPDWLKALAVRFAPTPGQMIGGRTLNALPDNLYSTTSQAIIDVVYVYYNADPDKARFFASNNMTLPAERFRAIGGFDPSFTASEDRDLCDRWLLRGYGMTYAPEAMIYHAHALTFRTFWRQHLNYGRGAFRFRQARLRRGSANFIEDAKFYARLPKLLRLRLSQTRGRRAFWLAGLLALWQVANAAGFLWEAVNQRGSREEGKSK